MPDAHELSCRLSTATVAARLMAAQFAHSMRFGERIVKGEVESSKLGDMCGRLRNLSMSEHDSFQRINVQLLRYYLSDKRLCSSMLVGGTLRSLGTQLVAELMRPSHKRKRC
jgi:hypothetical protein